MIKTTLRTVLFFSLLFISTLISGQQSWYYDWVTASPFPNDLNPNYSSTAFATGEGGEQYSAMLSAMHYNTGMEFLGNQEVTKRDAQGNTEWILTLVDTIFIRQIAANPNGGCVLFGDFAGDLQLGGFNIPDNEYLIQTFLFAVSETGNIDTLILASPSENMTGAISFKIANEKIYAMVGGAPQASQIEIYDAESYAHLETIFHQNTKTMGDIDVDPAGNIYITGSCLNTFGQTSFNGTLVADAGEYNKFLLKYNNAHQLEWIRTFDDITCPQPKVRISPDGNSIYMSDNYLSSFTMGNTALEGSTGTYDFYVARFNPDGDILWAKEIPNFSIVDAQIGNGNFLVAENSGVAFTGSYQNSFTWNQDTLLSAPNSNLNVFVIKLDENGDNIWVKGVQSQNGNTFGNSLCKAGDAYYLNGFMDGDCTFSDNYAFTGDLPRRFTAKLSNLSTGISSLSGNAELTIYPNPANDFLKIDHSNALNGLHFKIYSITGKQVYQGVLNDTIETIDFRSYPAGFYILQVNGAENCAVRFVKIR